MIKLRLSVAAALLILSSSARGEWVAVTESLLKSEKTGFGGLCGIVVDHGTGTAYLDLSDRGLYRSTDQGKSWQPTSDTLMKGRTEWPGCLTLDPTGKTKRLL